jgi:hypothetical protein
MKRYTIMAEKTICGFISDIMNENAAKNNSPENDEDYESQVYREPTVHHTKPTQDIGQPYDFS